MVTLKSFKVKLVIGCTAFAFAGSLDSCSCDSQSSPQDAEQQFDPDTINAPKAKDSVLSEKMYPMQTDSLNGDKAKK